MTFAVDGEQYVALAAGSNIMCIFLELSNGSHRSDISRSVSRNSMPLSVRFLAITMMLAALVSCDHRAHAGGITTRMRWSSGTETRTIEIRGSVEFADDDRDVKTISPGGSLSIEDGNWLGSGRSYTVRADSNGSLSRTYQVAGRPKVIDGDAQAWIAGAMLSLIRESGLGAKERVERFLAKGGATAVLREVSAIHSDGSKRKYLSELVKRARLSDEELRDVMRSARTIGSDGDKTELLIDISNSYLKGAVSDSWFTTLRGVGSDGDKRRGLEHAAWSAEDADTLAMTAKVAGEIGSDGDKAAALSAIGSKGLEQTAVRGPWFQSVRSIGSDGDKARVLSSALVVADRDADILIEILRAAETIGSDGDKARVLAEAARSDLRSDAARRAFLAAAGTIGSDGDRRNVLTALLRPPALDPSIVALVAESAKGIGSDGDKAAVLSRVTKFELNDVAARSAFFMAVNSIGSDGNRAEVLSNVLRSPSVAPETAVAAIDGAARIGSDGEKVSLLVLAAERHGSIPIVRASLEKALKSVHSDGQYRRIAEALRR